MRHVFRRLAHSPLFTCITLLTLAIGIGANTAVFSVVEGVLLKPLPYPHPEELVSIMHTAPGINIKDVPSASSHYFVYQDENRSFQGIGMWNRDRVAITGVAEPEQVEALNVTYGLLSVLGVPPAAGRAFTEKDDSPGSPRTVMLSYGYWRRRFGGDPHAVGRTIQMDERPFEIVGVLPNGFAVADVEAAVLRPMQLDRGQTFLGNYGARAIGRLKPGVTLAQASADVARMIPMVMHRFPPPPGASVKLFETARIGPNLRMLKQEVVGDTGNLLWVLMGTIGIVLLIACANVANLLLVRAEGRQHELAIRAALGAGRGRIAGELLLESILLGVAGGALGIAVAAGGIRALVAAAPAGLPRLREIGIDGWVLLFNLAISLAAGVFFGLIPVLKYAGPQIASSIRQGARTLSQSRERYRARSVLVVVQVALALVLLVGGGLMIRTFQAMRKVYPGFRNPKEVQSVTISIPGAQVKEPERVVRMQQAILGKIGALPGLTAAGYASAVPMDGSNSFNPIFVEDHPLAEGQMPGMRRFKFMAPGFLGAMGNPLVAGRDFNWTDVYSQATVTIVTENLAREYWGNARAALGKRVRETLNGPWREIVGVAGNERDDGVDRPAPTSIYFPMLARDFWGEKIATRRTVTYLIRSPRTGSQAFLSEIRQAIWSVNPALPLARVGTLEEIYDKSMARTSFTMLMLGVAGAMSLLLALIGIYGVISYSVSQRTREIGIRLALGAGQTSLRRMFVGYGLRLAAMGLLCGLAAAFALTRMMTRLLYGVTAGDPLTYTAIALGLAAAAALASYLPSRRATSVNPVEALRAE
jgi:predicted permease